MMDYGLSWTIVDYCGTLWTIVDYHRFLNMHNHGIHGLQDMHPKPLTTPKRCGAGMADTVASIGHVLSSYYCGLLRIIDYHRLSWIIVDYLELLLITIDYGSWRIIMDYGQS